ncbi:MAG: hypothetical protein EAZ91_04685 [Cytophagales bacterium]|nr:MAG: hypothetical protein EAZ91_04685 [Cytophagales bacterium]
MAYSDFTLLELKEKFGLNDIVAELFPELPEVEPGPLLTAQLERAMKVPLRNEKAKSELIVSPILLELVHRNNDFFTFYSGENLPADRSKGLVGECDFFISRYTGSFAMNMPVLAIIEAKRDNLESGVDQCAAQLYGASLVNENLGHPVPIYYGCVTNAREWLFMKLEHHQYTIDTRRYTLDRLPQLLGIFEHILNFYRGAIK